MIEINSEHNRVVGPDDYVERHECTRFYKQISHIGSRVARRADVLFGTIRICIEFRPRVTRFNQISISDRISL